MPGRPSLARRLIPLFLLATIILVVVVVRGCGSPPKIANRNPVGERLPTVTGASLEESPVTLPDDLAGEPAILLVGYVQETQFDLDRWLMGLLQAEASARIIEVPTIPGLLPTIASGWIDEGMRSGIPPEDWASVVTLYGSAAEPIARLTGTESPRRGRVIVLDETGTVAWFDDEGYSVSKAMAIADLLEELRGE